MPLLNSLATPYADALLQVTDSRKESEEVAAQCKTLLTAWESSEPLRELDDLSCSGAGCKEESFNKPSC